MDPSNGNYSYLINKIDEFIRKYYLNKIVRGSIYLSAALFTSYLIITSLEYYGNFGGQIRAMLFFSFLAVNLSIAFQLILRPLLALNRLGKVLSHHEASEIIGKHFSGVKDKLLNTLQLKKLADENPEQRALIQASIDQKIAQLAPVPFSSAIRIKDNRKYLRFAVPPLLVIILIAVTAPAIFSEGTERIINYDRKYVKKAPFRFIVLNKDLSVVQGEELELKVKMEGEEIPQDIYVEEEPNSFKLEKENLVRFHYTFRNVQKTKQIRLSAHGYRSEPIEIRVKKRPALLEFQVRLDYPGYLRKPAESLANTGDLTVPEGTRVTWNFKTENASRMLFGADAKTSVLKPLPSDLFRHSIIARKNSDILLKVENNEAGSNDWISYKLKVVPDLRPSIEVSVQKDSINNRSAYFTGKITDDHGFSGLKFHYRVLDRDRKSAFRTERIGIDQDQTENSFFYAWDARKKGIQRGMDVEYFFEVFDNDGVNGYKSTRTDVRLLKFDSQQEVEQKIDKTSEDIKDKMEKAIRYAKTIERDAQKINRNLLSKKSLSFDEKKQIENLLQKQAEMQQMISEIKKENSENLYKQNDLHNQKREILEKQKQIENLFENVLDEKTKELLKNIQELLDQSNKSQTQQELSKMQMDNKSLQKELDRMLELYKQLEFDQKLSATVEKLKSLGEEQRKLSEEVTKSPSDKEKMSTRQQDLNKKFGDIKENLNELDKKNSSLEQKNSFESPKGDQDAIEALQASSTKNLRNKDAGKAAENMKQAAARMKQLAERIEKQQEESESQEQAFHLQDLRQILANLLRSSFEQENVLMNVRNTRTSDPAFINHIKKQKDVRDNLKLVQDSLYSLSRKAPQIEAFVNKEIESINTNIGRALENLEKRNILEANKDEQYALTSINNLALMLSEVEEKMQNAMKSARQGGSGKQKSLSQLSKMQEQLNNNMQKAREQLKQQGLKEGQQASKGQLTEQMARMAREQQLIRQALMEVNRDLNKDGKGRLGDLDKLTKEMEQTETDLVNKRIRQETMFRQQEVLGKLLQAEKAERERETDSQRDSKEGRDQSTVYNSVLDNFKKIKQRETELLKTVPPSLSLFYQLKVGDYFRHLDSK